VFAAFALMRTLGIIADSPLDELIDARHG